VHFADAVERQAAEAQNVGRSLIGGGMPLRQKAHGYREKAEELRAIAQDFTNAETKQILAKLATDCERMAVALERTARQMEPEVRP
jgi:hypothetical protein